MALTPACLALKIRITSFAYTSFVIDRLVQPSLPPLIAPLQTALLISLANTSLPNMNR